MKIRITAGPKREILAKDLVVGQMAICNSPTATVWKKGYVVLRTANCLVCLSDPKITWLLASGSPCVLTVVPLKPGTVVELTSEI